MQTITIKELCHKVGVNPNTLRAWERRYKVVQPLRTESGRRRYSQAEIQRLSLIVELLGLGQFIGNLAPLSTGQLKELKFAISKDADNESDDPSQISQAAQEEFAKIKWLPSKLRELELLIGEFKSARIEQSLAELRTKLTPREFALGVLSPMFQHIGDLVAEGKCSIAQEHAFSAVVRNQISPLIEYPVQKQNTGLPAIALATVEGDIHEFGILIASILARLYGFPVEYLGSNLPAQSAIEAMHRLKCDILLIGSTEATNFYTSKPFADSLKLIAKAAKEHHFDFWLGGNVKIGASFHKLAKKPRLIRTLWDLDMLLYQMSQENLTKQEAKKL